MNKVYEYIDEHKEQYINELFPLLMQHSISPQNDVQGIQDCAKLLAGMMTNMGIDTRIFPTKGMPIVYGEVLSHEEAPTILIYGHYDVMPVEPLEEWKTDPFKPEIIEGKIFARGASDDKGQSFTYLKGYEAYKNVYGNVPVNIKYLFDGEEEIGSPSLLPFVLDNLEMLKADVLLSSDSKIHESGRPVLFLGLKGMCSVDIEVKSAEKDLHSMYAPVAPSSAWRLIGLLNTLKGEDGTVKIDGFYDDVIEPTELEKETTKKIPFDKESVFANLTIKDLVENRTGKDYYYNYIFEPTCNIGYMGVGYETGVKDIVPKKATARIDMNLVPNQKPEKILATLRKYLDKNGYEDVEIKPCSMMVPYRTAIDNKYVPVVEEAIREVWKKDPVILPGIGGFGPNFVFSDNLNIPNIYIPYGALDNSNHAPNESLVIDGFMKGIKIFATIINKISTMD